MEITRLNNFILWCKNWYALTPKVLAKIDNKDNEAVIFETLKRVLALDGYEYIRNMRDIFLILNSYLQDFNEYAKKNHMKTLEAYDLAYKIEEQFDRWSLTNDKSLSYYIAFVLSLRSFFSWYQGDLKLTKPHYDKKLYKFGLTHREILSGGTTYKKINKELENYAWTA